MLISHHPQFHVTNDAPLLKRVFFIFLAVFLFTASLAIAESSQSNGVSLDDLDAIVQKAKDWKDFRKRPKLVDEYYLALAKYHGGPKLFPRQAFDEILKQADEAVAKMPELATRFWEVLPTEKVWEISLTGIPGTGRTIGGDWNEYWDKFLKTLRDEGAEYLTKSSFQTDYVFKTDEATLSKLKELKQKEFEILRAARTIPTRSARAKAQAEAVASAGLLKDPQFKAMSAAFLYHYLAQEKVQDALRSNNADIIIKALADVKNLESSDFLHFVPGAFKDAFPSSVLTGMHHLALDPNQLLNGKDLKSAKSKAYSEADKVAPLPQGEHRIGRDDLAKIHRRRDAILARYFKEFNDSYGALFPLDYKLSSDGHLVMGGKASVVRMMLVPRRIHALFKGIRLNECVGGRCDTLDALSPERWATAALSGAKLYHTYSGEEYDGFLQLFPVHRVQTPEDIYASLDIGSPVFAKKVTVSAKGKTKTSVFQLWWQNVASRQLPTNWKGYAVGESNAINNASVVSTVHSEAGYELAEDLGPSSEFESTDSLAKKIVQFSKRFSNRFGYAGRMITDATVPTAGRLRKLKANEDIAKLLKDLLGSENLTNVERGLDFLKKHNEFMDDPGISERLGQLTISSSTEHRSLGYHFLAEHPDAIARSIQGISGELPHRLVPDLASGQKTGESALFLLSAHPVLLDEPFIVKEREKILDALARGLSSKTFDVRSRAYSILDNRPQLIEQSEIVKGVSDAIRHVDETPSNGPSADAFLFLGKRASYHTKPEIIDSIVASLSAGQEINRPAFLFFATHPLLMDEPSMLKERQKILEALARSLSSKTSDVRSRGYSILDHRPELIDEPEIVKGVADAIRLVGETRTNSPSAGAFLFLGKRASYHSKPEIIDAIAGSFSSTNRNAREDAARFVWSKGRQGLQNSSRIIEGLSTALSSEDAEVRKRSYEILEQNEGTRKQPAIAQTIAKESVSLATHHRGDAYAFLLAHPDLFQTDPVRALTKEFAERLGTDLVGKAPSLPKNAFLILTVRPDLIDEPGVAKHRSHLVAHLSKLLLIEDHEMQERAYALLSERPDLRTDPVIISGIVRAILGKYGFSDRDYSQYYAWKFVGKFPELQTAPPIIEVLIQGVSAGNFNQYYHSLKFLGEHPAALLSSDLVQAIANRLAADDMYFASQVNRLVGGRPEILKRPAVSKALAKVRRLEFTTALKNLWSYEPYEREDAREVLKTRVLEASRSLLTKTALTCAKALAKLAPPFPKPKAQDTDSED
jgi:hypothetical protein